MLTSSSIGAIPDCMGIIIMGEMQFIVAFAETFIHFLFELIPIILIPISPNETSDNKYTGISTDGNCCAFSPKIFCKLPKFPRIPFP